VYFRKISYTGTFHFDEKSDWRALILSGWLTASSSEQIPNWLHKMIV